MIELLKLNWHWLLVIWVFISLIAGIRTYRGIESSYVLKKEGGKNEEKENKTRQD